MALPSPVMGTAAAPPPAVDTQVLLRAQEGHAHVLKQQQDMLSATMAQQVHHMQAMAQAQAQMMKQMVDAQAAAMRAQTAQLERTQREADARLAQREAVWKRREAEEQAAAAKAAHDVARRNALAASDAAALARAVSVATTAAQEATENAADVLRRTARGSPRPGARPASHLAVVRSLGPAGGAGGEPPQPWEGEPPPTPSAEALFEALGGGGGGAGDSGATGSGDGDSGDESSGIDDSPEALVRRAKRKAAKRDRPWRHPPAQYRKGRRRRKGKGKGKGDTSTAPAGEAPLDASNPLADILHPATSQPAVDRPARDRRRRHAPRFAPPDTPGPAASPTPVPETEPDALPPSRWRDDDSADDGSGGGGLRDPPSPIRDVPSARQRLPRSPRRHRPSKSIGDRTSDTLDDMLASTGGTMQGGGGGGARLTARARAVVKHRNLRQEARGGPPPRVAPLSGRHAPNLKQRFKQEEKLSYVDPGAGAVPGCCVHSLCGCGCVDVCVRVCRCQPPCCAGGVHRHPHETQGTAAGAHWCGGGCWRCVLFADLAAATTNGRQQLEAEQSDQYRFGGTADEFAYKSLTASHTRPDELVERYKILRQIKSMRKKVGAAHCPPSRCCVCVCAHGHARSSHHTTPG